MYPSILDMNENESSKYLRMLELDAYANILAALRAQGPPTSDKLKLLKDIGAALRIPQERCKAEIRKVILDERLNTIAYFSCGQLETSDEWIKEGRRLISLMPRVAPQTIYSAIADEVADAASINNEQLPFPAQTECKRTPSTSQVQLSTSESSRPQPFRLPETFKSEDTKKRKMPFGVESSSLVQHLIGPSKVSRIQQIYRQKVKATAAAKEEQLKTKVKQEPDHDYRNLHQQNRILHHPHFTSKVQKLPLSSSSASPKINILQNISIQAPIKNEDIVDHIKNETNNIQKTLDQNHTSVPSSSNENQAPKPQKQAIVNIKANANITYKHVASPGPSSEIQKSLKVCTTRKPLTKGIAGQKLIIVSNAQSINTSSILQRTLTIPFVKNVSVKNFDKFKIVSTSTNTSTLQLTSLANATANTFTTNSAKHKVVTVRTNTNNKKIIPLAHLHALNAKGSIKMLPVGGKILSKATTTSSPLYIMNNVGGIQAITKSTSSTPVVMTCRPQDPITDLKVVAKNKVQTNDDLSYLENDSIDNFNDDGNKTSVLADILKASGVISPDNEHISVDYETQISQFAIPQSVPEKLSDHVAVDGNFEVIENSEVLECQEEIEDHQNDTYILLGNKNEVKDNLLNHLEEDSSDILMDSLDNDNSEYCADAAVMHCDGDIEGSELTEDSYMVEIEHPQTNINAIN
ncbi:hypothetical protein RN001_008084 [Aquatica leii]|uniref:ENT domain-containing protein n=1 Tax=Aquatica leii TaxID=1421715 RepID=A0AAN7PAB7_9COLE|nr:hypothetical protein RN001_008084 [Aquatica leii]